MAKMVIGTEEVKKIMFGTEEVSSLAIGEETVPVDGGGDYSKKPFTIEIVEDKSTSSAGTLTLTPSSSALVRKLSYSKNGGEAAKIDIGGSTTSISIPVVWGDKIEFFVETNQNGTADSNSSFIKFGSDWMILKTYGNIMSLAFADYQSQTALPSDYCFAKLFYKASYLEDAENLILPATSVTENCYDSMFYDCRRMTKTPKILPALTVVKFSYQEMFYNCWQITSGPELPATVLAMNCYSSMFNGCKNLDAPQELPATVLAQGCYYAMYKETKVTYIKCLATNISARSCLDNWLKDGSATGTFVKAAGVTWPTGISGIPEGWTVVEE